MAADNLILFFSCSSVSDLKADTVNPGDSTPSRLVDTVQSIPSTATTYNKVNTDSNSTLELLVGAPSDASSVNTSCLFPSTTVLNTSVDLLYDVSEVDGIPVDKPVYSPSHSGFSRLASIQGKI